MKGRKSGRRERGGGGKEKLQTGSGGVLRPTKAGATGSNDQVATYASTSKCTVLRRGLPALFIDLSG
ncbi:unnamed protein product [Spirodela intermedia]|uniref:Uncharacterized protein n=1 Tax=Spirodela intermedia TaxID=51605 RepID=A0ABN7EDK3_SPIIN|nr:unnamed protein product [Spirodela intermedia]